MTTDAFLKSLATAGNTDYLERLDRRFRAKNKKLMQESLRRRAKEHVIRTQLSSKDIADRLGVSPKIVREIINKRAASRARRMVDKFREVER